AAERRTGAASGGLRQTRAAPRGLRHRERPGPLARPAALVRRSAPRELQKRPGRPPAFGRGGPGRLLFQYALLPREVGTSEGAYLVQRASLSRRRRRLAIA